MTLLYTLVNVSYLTAMSPVELHESETVAVTWIIRFFDGEDSNVGLYLSWIMTAFVAMSTFGAANGSLFCSGRYWIISSVSIVTLILTRFAG